MLPYLQGVKILHLEPTTGCNLRCPQCARTTGDLPNDYLVHGELSLQAIKDTVPQEFIRNLDKMFMCGNFGEPAMAKDCLEIFRYFREVNPNIVLGMNTNGSLRNPKWWKELAGIMNQPFDYVVWSIDGLEDTNHIYRRDAVWSKIMSNSQAFIDAAGSAHWDFLVFEHNRHQTEQAEALAASMGFRWFRLKETERPVHQSVIWLKKVITPSQPITARINCQALEEKSIFLNARGEWLPCCYIGTKIDVERDMGLRDIKEDVFDEVMGSLATNPHQVCRQTCSVVDETVRVKAKWKKNVQF